MTFEGSGLTDVGFHVGEALHCLVIDVDFLALGLQEIRLAYFTKDYCQGDVAAFSGCGLRLWGRGFSGVPRDHGRWYARL